MATRKTKTNTAAPTELVTTTVTVEEPTAPTVGMVPLADQLTDTEKVRKQTAPTDALNAKVVAVDGAPYADVLAADAKRQKVLETLARARAIRAEQLAADPNREKAKASKAGKVVSPKEVLGSAMGDLAKIVKRLQQAQCHEIADRLRGEIARIRAALAEGE